MACKTNFAKIVILDNKSYIIRCCALEPLDMYTLLDISDEILEDSQKLKEYIFSKLYEVPKSLKDAPQSEQCHSHCIEAFDKKNKVRVVGVGLPTCNLACPTCRKEHILHVQEKTKKIYFKVLNALKGSQICLYPNLNGEPFFYKKEMKEFIDSIETKDFESIQFTSNMTMMTDEDIASIIALSKKTRVSVSASIDSVFESTFRKLRFPSTKLMFDRALENIDKLTSFGIPVNASITISDLNSSAEELEAYGQYFSSRGIQIAAVVAFYEDDMYGHLRTDETVINFVNKYHVWFRNA